MAEKISNASWNIQTLREKDPLIMTATNMSPNLNRVKLNGKIRASSNQYGNGIITDADEFGFLSDQAYIWILFQAFPNYRRNGTYMMTQEIRSSTAALLDNRWAVVGLMNDTSVPDGKEIAKEIGETIVRLMVV